MPKPLEFIQTGEKPALIALNRADEIALATTSLEDLGFKVHTTTRHQDFVARYGRIAYQVVVLDEGFAGATLFDNKSLRFLQLLPMNQRRHAVTLLVGPSFTTLDAFQAFQQSVHQVIHPDDLLPLFSQIVQKTLADNDQFLHAYRTTQNRLSEIR